jgi:hypothetical protein
VERRGEGRYLRLLRKSGRAEPQAPSLIKLALNPKGQTAQLRLLYIKLKGKQRLANNQLLIALLTNLTAFFIYAKLVKH